MKKILIYFFFILAGTISAQIVERPNPPRLYNNLSKEFPDFLNTTEAAQLEEKLEQFSNQTSNQICIVIVDELNGYEPSEYAFNIGNKWGVGKADKDNGIVILIKPTESDGGRALFIATGLGLEGAIPDLATKKIRDKEITPYLKKGQYYIALDRGTDVLMQLAKGEINVQDYTRHSDSDGNQFPAIIIIIIAVILLLRYLFGGGGGGRTFSRTGNALFWGSMLGGGMGRGGGGSSSGGGGWGGFGGGSFGGGGSGGSW